MKHFNMTEKEQLHCCAKDYFAWPGGYEIFVITTDGGVICYKCVRENYRLMLESLRDDMRDGWQIEVIDTAESCEGSTLCDNCYRELSPYVEE